MYYIQFKNETVHETVCLSDGFMTLAEARDSVKDLKAEGASVWRIVKVKTDKKNYRIHMLSVHKLVK